MNHAYSVCIMKHSLHNAVRLARLDQMLHVPSMLKATLAISPAWNAEAIVIIKHPLDMNTTGSCDVNL